MHVLGSALPGSGKRPDNSFHHNEFFGSHRWHKAGVLEFNIDAKLIGEMVDNIDKLCSAASSCANQLQAFGSSLHDFINTNITPAEASRDRLWLATSFVLAQILSYPRSPGHRGADY